MGMFHSKTLNRLSDARGKGLGSADRADTSLPNQKRIRFPEINCWHDSRAVLHSAQIRVANFHRFNSCQQISLKNKPQEDDSKILESGKLFIWEAKPHWIQILSIND